MHDQPGITRDVITAEVADGAYTLLDTGGLGYRGEDTPAALTKMSEQQVEFAIASADLILFVVDGRAGLSSLDERIAQLLRHGQQIRRLYDHGQLAQRRGRANTLVAERGLHRRGERFEFGCHYRAIVLVRRILFCN